MAGQAVLPLLLICLVHVAHVICAQNSVRVVNVPPDIVQSQQVDYLPEEDLQKPRERSFAEDTTTESTTLDSNPTTMDDIELAQNFLDVERKYVNLIKEFETKVSQDASTSEESHLNEIEDVQFAEIPLDSKLAENFLESERYHTYSADDRNVAFSLKSSVKEGSSNVNVCGTVNLDKIVDELLEGIRHDMIEKGLDTIKIPDINEKFVKKVGFIEVGGYFHGELGWARNLSTIQRTADVIASSQGTRISISCGFGLSHLEFGYDKYKAKFMKIGPSGKLDVTISKNSLLLNATVTWSNSTCKTTLDYLSLDKLGGFNLKMTGLGPFNWLFTKISDWLFKKFHQEIKEKIEITLKEEIEKELKTFDCTRYLLGSIK